GDFAASRAAWRKANVRFARRLPPAFAIGVARSVHVTLEHEHAREWACLLYDHADASLAISGLPLALRLPPGKRVTAAYDVTPTRRGEVAFAPAEARVRS